MTTPTVIKIDNVSYVREDSLQSLVDKDGLPCVVIRGTSSGAFVGYLKSRVGTEVHLLQCRRLWYWEGAASLSQLAVDGVSKPKSCKFPAETPEHFILDAIEVIPCTAKAKKTIDSVAVWAA